MKTLLELLNRLAMSTEPKTRINNEFGEIAKDALTKGWITSDFFNYGISPSGQAKRLVLRKASSTTKPAAPIATSSVPVPPDPVPAEPIIAPVLERAKPIAAATTSRSTMKKSKPTSSGSGLGLDREPRASTEHGSTQKDQRPTFNTVRLVEAILRTILVSGDGLTAMQVATKMDLSVAGVQAHLAKLLKSEQIIRSGTGKQSDGFRYCKPDSAVRSPEDIQSSYATAPTPAKPIAPAPAAMLKTRPAPVITDPYDTVLDDLELEIAAAQNVIAALRPLKREMRDRVVRMITGRFEAGL